MHSLSLSLMKSLFVLMRKKIIIIHYFVSLWKPSRISLLTINRKSEKNNRIQPHIKFFCDILCERQTTHNVERKDEKQLQ